MWRGVTRWKPILTGASMVRIGWHKPAKLLLYPIRDNIDAEGRQLVNWVVDIEQETPIEKHDWNRPGNLDDFIGALADWHFDWLDVPAIHPQRRRDPRISDGRPGSAAALELRARSRCSAMPRIRCIRAARTARRRRSSTARALARCAARRIPTRWPR